jgi:hypothetical protein
MSTNFLMGIVVPFSRLLQHGCEPCASSAIAMQSKDYTFWHIATISVADHLDGR